MEFHSLAGKSSTLDELIDRSPLTVAPNTPLVDVMAQMSQVQGSQCAIAPKNLGGIGLSCSVEAAMSNGTHAHCALVLDQGTLVGILTERDIVRLVSKGTNLQNMQVKEVMNRQPITLSESDYQDIFSIFSLLRQYQIRHLPVLKEQKQLVGIITPESLGQILQPVNLLRMRSVEEVMTSEVVHADPKASGLNLARLMAQNQVGCVVIVEEKDLGETSIHIPLGLVTARDIVQLQVLEMDLENLSAIEVMSSPLVCLHFRDTLWAAHQQMRQQGIGRLGVVGDRGELLGIISQTRLFHPLTPLELYDAVEILQDKVARLEVEKMELLQQHHEALEKEIADQTIKFKQQTDCDRLLAELRERQQAEAELRIRAHQQAAVAALGKQALAETDLETLMDDVVAQVAQILNLEYSAVFELLPNKAALWLRAGVGWHKGCVKQAIVGTNQRSQAGYTLLSSLPVVVRDLRLETRFSSSPLLHNHSIVSGISVIIPGKKEPFGVLSVHTKEHRTFSQDDVSFLQNVANLLAIAIERKQAEEELNHFFNLSLDLFCISGFDYYFRRINPRFETTLGYSQQELLTQSFLDFVHPEDRANTMEEIQKLSMGIPAVRFENRYRCQDGSYCWLAWTATPFAQGVFYAVARDITESKKSEKSLQQLNEELELRVERRTSLLQKINQKLWTEIVERQEIEAERKYRARQQEIIVKLGQQALLGTDLKSLISQVVLQVTQGLNVEYCKVLEVSQDQQLFLSLGIDSASDNYIVLNHEPIPTQYIDDLSLYPTSKLHHCLALGGFSVAIKGKNKNFGIIEVYDKKKQNFSQDDIHFLQSVANVLATAIERKRAEKKLKSSLKEKEVLLKEIHHRVKNNLLVVSSLLEFQTDYIDDPEILKMFEDSQNRIHSMALIHEKLYRSKDLIEINFTEYIEALFSQLFESYQYQNKGIEFELILEQIYLNIETANPCGLIINELISNIMKHAFPEQKEGKVWLKAYQSEDQKITIIIQDNGIGFPQNLDFQNTESLGMQLVCTLTEQLEGTIHLNRSQGTQFCLQFSELNYQKRF